MPEIELLVRTSDGPAGRRKGDIVSVKELPHKGWGKGETLPNYLVIRINDTGKKGFAEYEGRHLHINSHDIKSPSKRSKYMLDLDNMPKNYAAQRPHLTLSKTAVTDKAILRSFI